VTRFEQIPGIGAVAFDADGSVRIVVGDDVADAFEAAADAGVSADAIVNPADRRGDSVPKATQGAIHRVPCPHCGQCNDFRAHADAESGGVGWGEQGLEAGAKVDCDHCGRFSKVLAVEKVVIIKLVAL
jgi:DNA-directed RNA polymerase subunit RPC12/RpoP